MKSFVTGNVHLANLQCSVNDQMIGEKILALCELYKNVMAIEGSIVKCGLKTADDFTVFTTLCSVLDSRSKKDVLAFFEKDNNFYTSNFAGSSATTYKVRKSRNNVTRVSKGAKKSINFIPGSLADSIPDYLIENPDLKISFLNIDLDDYDAAIIALQYFYPRLAPGGLLVFENYHKKQGEYRAVADFFRFERARIYNFSNKGPYYTLR